MKQLSCLAFAILWWTAGSFGGTAPIYINTGNIQAPLQIDASAFLNEGIFSVAGGSVPYETQNTLNFTNRGYMASNPGFRLLFIGTDGYRRFADNVINEGGARIVGVQPNFIGFGPGAPTPVSYVWIDATNLVNSGTLEVGTRGLIRLNAKHADLSRSGLLVGSADLCGFELNPLNFFPDDGITDLYWGVGPLMMVRLNAGAPSFKLPTPISPSHLVTNAPAANGFQTRIAVQNANAFVYTNAVDPSNWVIQAVFVQKPASNLTVQVRFAPSQRSPGSSFLSPIIEYASIETNVVDKTAIAHTLYFLDRLASETNFVIATNLSLGFPGVPTRPAPYLLTHCTPNEWVTGFRTNATFDPLLIYDPNSISNAVVDMTYAAYAANIASDPPQPAIPAAGPTNSAGRIEIEAESLNLERARIRAQQYLSIKTDHLITSSNAVVSSPRLSYNLASTNGALIVKNLAEPAVVRLAGTLRAWSGIWTNVFTYFSTNMPGTTNEMIMTNDVTIGYHVLLVNTALTTSRPTVTGDIVTHGTNTVLGDDFNIADRFIIDAQQLTISGTIRLLSSGAGLGFTNFPSLNYFTNLGTLQIPSSANFGFDRPNPYVSFVNRGSINAVSTLIRANNFENSGGIAANVGSITLDVDSGKLEGGLFSTSGSLASGGDVNLNGGSLKFRDYTIQSGGGLNLNVANNLYDSGAGAGNTFTVARGFNLFTRPAGGDLLGTTIKSTAPLFTRVQHFWAGEDRGATRAGYSNNVAIGHLTLDVAADGLLTFSGTGANNALYVDLLEIGPTALASLQDAIQIDPNLTIYFAIANVPVEQLDGQLNGRLKWVSDFAGPNSSIDVLLPNGQTIQVNRALLESTTIDSDGDGIPNAFDLTPFDGVMILSTITILNFPPPTALITWQAAGETVYHVEYTTNPLGTNWQPLLIYKNTATKRGPVTVQDTVNGEQRYYRVVYYP